MNNKIKFFIKVIICLVTFIRFSCGDAYAVPTYSQTEKTLKIRSNSAGEMSQLNLGDDKVYEKVEVEGKLSYFDLIVIKSLAEKYKVLDLSNATLQTEFLADVFQNLDGIESFKFPNNTECIVSGTLNNCPNLKNVNVPKNLVEVSEGSFQNCPQLKLEIPSEVKCAEDRFIGSPGVKHLELKLPYKSYSVFSSILSWVGL